jgi:hypothetical protein
VTFEELERLDLDPIQRAWLDVARESHALSQRFYSLVSESEDPPAKYMTALNQARNALLGATSQLRRSLRPDDLVPDADGEFLSADEIRRILD